MSEVLPRTPLPTVYSTLELLDGLELVRRVGTGNRAIVFDSASSLTPTPSAAAAARWPTSRARPHPTMHFARASAGGFVPDHAQLVVWGLCRTCAATAAAAASLN